MTVQRLIRKKGLLEGGNAMSNSHCYKHCTRRISNIFRNLFLSILITGIMTGTSTLSGCKMGYESYPFEYGVCTTDSVIITYTLDDVEFVDERVSARLWFSCAYTWNSGRTTSPGSGIDCYDPANTTGVWESQDWAITLEFCRLGNAEGCGRSPDTSLTKVTMIFDVSSGVPLQGKAFDLSTISEYYFGTTAWDAEYEITGGEIIFKTTTANEYSYEINNLTLTMRKDHDYPDFAECETPGTIIIESISATCEPEIQETTWW